MKIRIYYEDTDAGGIVYHANYLKYCERARSEIFFQRGIMPYGEEEIGFVVRRVEADFVGMAKLGDLLEVRTDLLEERHSSILLEQQIFRGEERIFSMKVLLVYVVMGRPRRIPEQLKEVIASLGS
ncbi:YbgC/FadM family acyl-CoA thioesterase [Nitratifractor salsuginis]|uniref:Thioesterase superfamily protein n=1 Tax=Nitratifractor salsuginis (strain DSM 16511 / JCM 12458 / E9I37-1) TaxID=749222 RepID=E6X044_NITSE|nr:YbgC/FadM family acyl-CoA thioesterase [Nitratifractor salsuginis]ADV46767.1 thioesterase superfamily protein [Nitratifractor salsuginis DSM 16511]